MQNAEFMMEELTRSSIQKAVEEIPSDQKQMLQDIRSSVNRLHDSNLTQSSVQSNLFKSHDQSLHESKQQFNVDSPNASQEKDLFQNEFNRSYRDAPAWKDLITKKNEKKQKILQSLDQASIQTDHMLLQTDSIPQTAVIL